MPAGPPPRLPSGVRLLAAALAASLAAGCVEPRDTATTCTAIQLAEPLLVLGTDHVSASALGRIGRDGCLTERADLSLGADPSLSSSNGRAFVCVRDQGVIHAIDPETALLSASYPAHDAAETDHNPHDVALAPSGDLWIARYDLPSVGIVAPDGAFRTVDLSSLADADGLPEMEAIAIRGDRAFVALERLARDQGYAPTGPGLLAILSTAPPHDLLGTIELAGQNPFGRMVPAGDQESAVSMVMPGAGDLASIDDPAAIERIDLDTLDHEIVMDEAPLAGSVVEAVIAGPTEAYAIVAGPPDANATTVVRIDPSRRAVTRTIAGPAAGFYHAGLALDGAYLVVGDRTPGAPAYRFFDRETGAEAGALVPSLAAPAALLTLAP